MSYLHWQYFLTLDDDLQRLSRFVEITPHNYPVHSIELVRIILAAGSEIDVVAKQLYPSPYPDPEQRLNIADHRRGITPVFPNLSSMKVLVPAHSLTFIPWETWAANATPAWWNEHQSVKHDRGANFERANLENAVNAVAGLFVLVAYRYKSEWENHLLAPRPSFFDLERQYRSDFIMNTSDPLP
jgi:hypothetical protein